MVDLVFAIYPIVFFYNVQLQPMVKAGLCGLMGLGVVYSLLFSIVPGRQC
jgi:hypothetical protein